MKLRAKGQDAIWMVILVAFCTCVERSGAAAQVSPNEQNTPTLAEIVERLAKVQWEDHLAARSYTVLRNYELVGKKPENSSEVQAEVSYSPPGAKAYTIRSTSGSGSGERVVRRVLEHETRMAPSWKEAALTEENYKFELLGKEIVEGHDCFVLKLTPRGDNKNLVRGRAWVDAKSFNVRRIEGAVQPPSWWLKHVEVTMQFSRVLGMWLQTAFIAKADVRFFGEHTLKEESVQIRTGDAAEVTAQTTEKTPTPPLNGPALPPAMVGAGVLSMPWQAVR